MLYPLPKGGKISHPALVAALAKPGLDILASLTPEKAHAWHMASCIPGEAGELFEALAVAFTTGDFIDRENVIEEIGDLEFYMEGLRAPLGITRDEAQDAGTIPQYAAQFGVVCDLPARAADVFDATKRWVIYNKPLDRAALVKALGDLDVVLCLIRMRNGIAYHQSLAQNVTKLGIRYDGGYSDTAAQARADKPGTIH